MKFYRHLLMLGIVLIVNPAIGQTSSKMGQYFGGILVVDSTSTVIIPTMYSASFFSSNKMTLFGDYYANIIFYNFKTDTSKKLFEQDTFIQSFSSNNYNNNHQQNKSLTADHIFYRVSNTDRNKNGRIDDKDPVILFVSDIHGDGLKALTSTDENVVDVSIFEKQKFMMLKIQRDSDGNGHFEGDDKDYYYVKLDMPSLTFGKKIEIR
jgi:hypothetical protein